MCTCILLVRQDRAEIEVDRREGTGWVTQVLYADDQLSLLEFGLSSAVREVYRDTPLAKRDA